MASIHDGGARNEAAKVGALASGSSGIGLHASTPT